MSTGSILVIGLGCQRGCPASTLRALLEQTLLAHGIEPGPGGVQHGLVLTGRGGAAPGGVVAAPFDAGTGRGHTHFIPL